MNLSEDLEYYLKFGYVFCTPERFLLAREMKREDDGESYVSPGQGDTWYVRMAVGEDSIKWFIERAPSHRKWVAWSRGFKTGINTIRYYDFEALKHRYHLT